jgi:hypothetical protein
MNNITLISCFCNNKEKLQVLKDTLIILNRHNLKSALISPIHIPEEISKLSNYTFITEENQVLDWPIKAIGYWADKDNHKLFTTVPDWGWTGLNHVKRLGEIFINYDYDFFNYIIYDTIITPQVIEVLKTGHKGIFYPSKRENTIWKVGLHLASLNKETLSKVLQKLTLESYLHYGGSDAYEYLDRYISTPLNLEIGNFPVEDKIYFNSNPDLINHSFIKGFKFFISSPDDRKENIKIIFYELKSPTEILINVNGKVNKHLISNGTLLDIGILKGNLNLVSLKYNNIEYDLTNKILELKHTTIEKL